MRTEWRDAAATIPVLVTVALYVDYLADGTALFIHGPRVMALTGLVLGLTACILGGWAATTKTAKSLSAPLGTIALLLAIVTLITGNEVALGVFAGTIALLRVVSTVRHLRLPPDPV